jgi:glycosyltransferase involved in cell wall biosynthesis
MSMLSVCLITYNHERTVREALDGILAQDTSFPFEIVVGDDASTDGTAAILAEYAARHPGRFHLRLAERNAGVLANFLGAFNACTGKYVALLEGDDLFAVPDKLELQVAGMEANPTATLCGTNAHVLNEREQSTEVFPGRDTAYLAGIDSILASNFFCTCTLMVRRAGPLAIPDALVPVFGDWALKLLFAERGDTLFLPPTTAVYRVTGDGAWSSLDPVKMATETLRVLRAFESYLGPSAGRALRPRIHKQIRVVSHA